ncbi:uncharacterized protein LOC143888591 [Tasmannia lanceolata]|uniref:uncharacterized protein LOC143888591 n=1 Tax=Tasmannia lanceolata TaxID=3420 RepID=UPI0040631491
MGKDCSPWHYRQHSPWYSLNLNCHSIPSDPGQQNINQMMFPSYMASTSRTLSGFAASELSPLKSVVFNEPQAWYCYDTRQNVTRAPKMLGESSVVSPCGKTTTNLGSATANKGLLSFDQSGNQTSLIFSSFGPPFQHPKPINASGCCAELPINKDSPIPDHGKTVSWCGESDETHVTGEHESEIHEDTEEFDALLYSDETDDDEVISTGHSPIEIAGYQKGR